jgi:O-antigen ligase
LLEKKRIALSFATLFWVIGAFGLLLSLSRAGWVGLAAAIGIFAIIAGTKHIRLAVLAIGVLAIVFVFLNVNLRYRVLLPFHGEKSAVSRVSLWGTGLKAIKENPVFGKGLTGFARNWDRLNTDPNIDRHNYPHNVFLNFWVETGLLGLISFILLSLFVVIRGYQNRSNTYALGIALFVITLLVQGMFDNPYLKNDLAMLFWMVLALGL